MSKQRNYPDSLSPATNIAALSMEAQREANRLEEEKFELTKKANRTAMIAAIAAVIAAMTSIINIIVTILNKTS